MYKKLMDLLSTKINDYNDELKEINCDINEIKDLYDILTKYDIKESSNILLHDNEKTEKLYYILQRHNKLSVNLLNKVAKLRKEYEDKYSNENILKSCNSLYKSNSISLELLQRKNKADEITNLCKNIIEYNNNFIINRYNALQSKKEEVKNEKKVYEYAKRNIKSNHMLIPRDIATINNLIYDIEDENIQKELFGLLNDYVILHIPKERKKEVIEKENNNYVFIDDNYVKEVKEDKYDTINKNYLMALRCFDNYKDVSLFLDSIKDKFDINVVISKIINMLKEDEEKLKSFLIRYVNLIEEDIEDIKDDYDNTNIVLFNGFLEKKNRILNDCIKSDIPNEYYTDIYKGLNLIKENGAEGKRQNIVKRKKVFKLRINSIRITFKRLSKNVYIILGVFKKDDKWGQNIINTTIKRDKELLLVEESILDSMDIKELWDEYVKQNNEMFEEINSHLKLSKSCLPKKKMI